MSVLSHEFYLVNVRRAVVAALLQDGPGNLGVIHIHLAAVGLEIN